MDTTKALRNRLLETERISSDDFARAQHFAHAQRTSLAKAIVTLGMLEYADIGEALAEIHGYPYQAPTTIASPQQVRAHMSTRCARRWKVLPIACDDATQTLTLCGETTERLERVQSIYRFLLHPHSLSFTVASDAEIEQALKTHFDPATDTNEETDGKRKLSGLDQLVKTTRSSGSRKPHVPSSVTKHREPRNAHRHVGSEQTPHDTQLNRALISAVRLLVSRDLSGTPARLEEIQVRVRYCQLLATRMKLSSDEMTALILSTWLSAFDGHVEELNQLQTPYALEDILVTAASSPPGPRLEALILSLVMSYQALLTRDTESRRDVGRLRSMLRNVWSDAAEHRLILESFLQLLMDEEFLTSFGVASGSVLILDPSELHSTYLGPPLTRQGYDVAVAPDVTAARATVTAAPPALIVIDGDLPSDELVTFIQEVKQRSDCVDVIFIVTLETMSMHKATLFMRAGADDVLAKPVDMELLLLKIERLLPTSTDDAEARPHGVQGSLEDMSFPDMLQILAAGGKSVSITLNRENESGGIYMRNGNVVHADVNEKQGDEAFHELAGWTTGTFSTEACDAFPEDSIETPTMSLLMEAARRLDEDSDGLGLPDDLFVMEPDGAVTDGLNGSPPLACET